MELFKGFIPVCKLLLEANAELFRYLASLWRCICYSAQRFSLSHVSICSQSCQHQQLITYANFLGSKRRAKLLLVLKSISQNLNYKKFKEIDPTDHDYLRTCHHSAVALLRQACLGSRRVIWVNYVNIICSFLKN